jgi:hypothetical protein
MQASSERVLSELLGIPRAEVEIEVHEEVPGPDNAWAIRPVDPDTLNRDVNPSLNLGSDDPQIEAVFDWSGRRARAEVSIWGGPEPAIVVTPYGTDPSYVLAIATIIAAARVGDGIGDAHVLLGDRLPRAAPSPADQDEVLRYLREPPGRHPTIDEAIAAVLAKTYLVRSMPRPSTAKR